jgi:hypothetical protein
MHPAHIARPPVPAFSLLAYGGIIQPMLPPRSLLLAVVWSQISSPPSADSAAAAALAQDFFGLKAIDR